MSNSDDNYTGILLEQILDEVKTIHELVAGQPTRDEFNEVKDGVVTVKEDIRIIKAAVTDQGKQVQNQEQRIGNLEVAH